MSHKTRKAYTAEEKVAILRRHLLEQTPVSDLCDQYQLHPTQFYRWQRQFFENGAAAFTPSTRSATAALEQPIAVLQAKLARQHEVLSELMEEYVRLKKERGEPCRGDGFPRTSAIRSSTSSSRGRHGASSR